MTANPPSVVFSWALAKEAPSTAAVAVKKARRVGPPALFEGFASLVSLATADCTSLEGHVTRENERAPC